MVRTAYLGFPAAPKESAFGDMRPFGANLIALEVLHKRFLEISHGLVVLLNQFGEIIESASNAGAVDLLTNLDPIHLEFPHEVYQPFVRPEVFGNLGDHQSAAVDSLLILVTSEPSLTQQDHLLPMIPGRVADQQRDQVDHRYVCPEDVAAEVLDREQTEVISRIGRDLFQVVYDVDGAARGK